MTPKVEIVTGIETATEIETGTGTKTANTLRAPAIIRTKAESRDAFGDSDQGGGIEIATEIATTHETADPWN